MPELNKDQFKLYHGTSDTLDTVLPAEEHGNTTWHGFSWPKFAYATTSLREARGFAESSAARRGGLSRVYEVSPVPGDSLEQDRLLPKTAYTSHIGFNVEREVPYSEPSL